MEELANPDLQDAEAETVTSHPETLKTYTPLELSMAKYRLSQLREEYTEASIAFIHKGDELNEAERRVEIIEQSLAEQAGDPRLNA